MSDKIEVGASASGEDGILKLVSAIDRLDASLGRLAQGNTALEQLQRSMASMQASMTTGFAEMAAQAAGGAEKIRKTQEASAEKMLRDQIKHEERQHAQANKFHHKLVEQQDTWLVKQRENYVSFWRGILAEQERAEAKMAATQQRRDMEMHNQRTKANSDYTSLWEKMLSQRQQIQERRDMELHAARQREHTDYVKFWEKHLSAQDAAQAKELEKARAQQLALHRIRASEEERGRTLNTNFMTASPAAQLRTANQAQTYRGLGGNAAEKYGSAAAGADIGALQRQLERIPAAAGNSERALRGHNDIMREGHSLARGLAGSLGGLWLTYGSLVPLVAGAALAASLKGVVETGKEVEHQLNFVAALTNQGVNLDRFITITDSSLRSVTEASNAMRALAQNGLTASQSLQVLPAVLKLATVGEMEVGAAALSVTGAAAAFNLQFTEAERVADIFAKTAATSNTSVLAMTESMKQASTASSLFKVSVEETAAMLGLLAKINITGGAAGTSFTNLLTGLYEPTNQGKRALKELGVEIQTQGGALKNYTQLMEELRGALGGYNDAARVDFLGDIFTVRGVKAAELALGNLDEYKKKVHEASEASGFMGGVLRKLEDDTEGAFKRLSVAVQNTFVKAFKDAAPYVQEIGLHLGDTFKDGSTQSGVTNLATNVARLTAFVVENAGAVGALVLAFAGFRMLGGSGGVIALINAASAATVASTAASGAATAAAATFNTAQVAGTATTAMYTASLEAQTAATVAATTASRAWMATLLPALGALGVAVGAAAALWLLFRDNTSEAERGNIRISNSLHTITEQLDKEIERLERSNALWDERNMKFRDEATVTPQAINAARTQVSDIEESMRKRGMDPEQALKGRLKRDDSGQWYTEMSREAIELQKARANLEALVGQENRGLFTVEPARALEKTRQAAAQLRTELEKYDAKAIGTDSFGEFIVKNDKARELMTDQVRGAAALRSELMDPSKQLADPDRELKRIEALRASFAALQEDVNGTLGGRAEKPDNRSMNDAFRAELEQVKNDLAIVTDQIKSMQSDLDSQYKSGTLSALDYYNKTRDLTVQDLNAKLDAFNKEEDIAARREKRTADVVKSQGKQAATSRAIEEADKARARGVNEYIQQQEQDQTNRLVAEERRRGNLRTAYILENQAKLKQLDANVAGGQSALAAAGGDSKKVDEATRFLDAAQKARNAYDTVLDGIGQTEDFQKAEDAFDSLYTKLSTGTAELVQKNTEGAGLASIFSNALAAQQLYSSSLDGLMAQQRALEEISNRPGATDEQKNSALDALKAIEAAGARMRDIWSNVGREVEKSLTRAFGNSGKAAGSLINITMDYAKRRKQIDDNLKKDSKDASPEDLAKLQQKAAKDTASAQIAAYGDMAGAAKGFFSEHSRGYAAMEAAERAFRAAELLMTMKDMAMKLFATETVTTAKLTGFGQEIAGAAATVPAVVAAEGTKQNAYGVSALASALSAPFPSNIPAFAMVAAMLAAIGVAVGGGGGGKPSMTAMRQETQGTGSVLGSKTAKSESINRSLELVEGHTYQNLAISMQMLNSLRAIESNIGNFSSLVMRTTGLGNGDEAFKKFESNDSYSALAKATIVGGLGFVGLATDKLLGGFLSKITGKIYGKVFGGKTSVEDTGFSMDDISFADIFKGKLSAYQYADVKKDGGWLGSDKYSTKLEGLGLEGNRQFALVLTSLYDAVFEAGKLLGLGADEFSAKLNSFVVDIGEISLKGLEGDALQKEIAAVFSKVGDDLAGFGVEGLGRFQQVGEGYLETLTRIAIGYQTVTVVMDSLGMPFTAVGLGSIEARQRLIDLAGGLEEFTSASQFFLENFFTEKEQAEALRRRVQPTLDQFGLSATGADPMKAFKDYVVGLDTTTQAGAQAYAALIQIAPAFKQIVDGGRNLEKVADEAKELQDQIDELTMTRVQLLKKERDALDPANQGLFDRLQQVKREAEAKDLLAEAYENESSKLEATIDRLKSFGESVRRFRDGLALGSASPLTPEQKLAAARAQFDSTFARAKAGDEGAQGSLESVAQAYLDASRTYNASGAAYTNDYQRVVAAMEEAERWAVKEANNATEQLTQLKSTVGALIDIKAGVLDVITAINNLALVKDPNNVDLQRKSITDLYDSILKRAPDQAGMDYWLKALQGGMSLNQISDLMKGSNEANNKPAAINDIYQQLLKRPADQAGMDYWMNALRNGSTIKDIFNAVKNSAEYLGTSTSTMSKRSSQMDVNTSPYSFSVDNSEVVEALSEVVAAVTQVRSELEELRDEQKEQTGAQIEATLAAAETNAEKIVEGTAKAVKDADWEANNKAEMQ